MLDLKNLSTDRSLDIICELLPYISNIKDNKKIIASFRNGIVKKKGETKEQFNIRAIEAGIDKAFDLAPLLLIDNRKDIYGILSVINEKSIEEIKKQNPIITIKEIKELIANEEIRELFL